MLDKTFEDFQNAFPDLHKDVYCGFDPPKGWNRIIWNLSEALSLINKNLAGSGYVHCAQVKEKFAGLRFYVDFSGTVPDETVKQIYNLIGAAESISFETCQYCGNPGSEKCRNGGWIFTCCDDCFNSKGKA